MRRRIRYALILLFVLVVVVPAYNRTQAGAPRPNTTAPTTSHADPPPPTPPAKPDTNKYTSYVASQPTKLRTDAVCAVQGDLENVFISPKHMPTYLECIIPLVEEWIDVAHNNAMPHPNDYYFIPRGVKAWNDYCTADSSSLSYCPGSKSIFLGEVATWEMYEDFGDAAMPAVVAHEATHHFQKISKMPRSDAPHEQIRYENQADCGAGAFMAYSLKKGYMNPEDDIADLGRALKAIGQAEGPERDHGTSQERLAAFKQAYHSKHARPLFACVAFVPEIPIIS